MKRFGLRERFDGAFALWLMSVAYVLLPREVEDHLFEALNLRMKARKLLHDEHVDIGW